MTLQELAAELLAAPVAVDIGRVEEGDPRVHRGLERGLGVARVHSTPVGAELPGSETYDTEAAPEALNRTLFHHSDSAKRWLCSTIRTISCGSVLTCRPLRSSGSMRPSGSARSRSQLSSPSHSPSPISTAGKLW